MQDHTPYTISVAMCTYNGELYVEEQLRSIVQQTRPVHEVVLCDDGSSDQTWAIVTRFAQNHPQIRWNLLRNEHNIGYLKNFENAIGLCSGDLIFLADQDDVWLPKKTETMLRYFQQNPHIHVLFTDAEIVAHDLCPLQNTMFAALRFTPDLQQRFYEDDGMYFMLNRYVVTGATVALKKQETASFFPLGQSRYYIHDAIIGILARLQNTLGFINEPLVLYRQHEKQSVGAGLANLNTQQPEVAREEGLWSRMQHPGYMERFRTILEKGLEKDRFIQDHIARNRVLIPEKNRDILQKRIKLMQELVDIPTQKTKRLKYISLNLYRYQIPEFTTLKFWFINTLNLLLAKK